MEEEKDNLLKLMEVGGEKARACVELLEILGQTENALVLADLSASARKGEDIGEKELEELTSRILKIENVWHAHLDEEHERGCAFCDVRRKLREMLHS